MRLLALNLFPFKSHVRYIQSKQNEGGTMRMQLLIRTLFVIVLIATFTLGQSAAKSPASPVVLTIGGEVANPIKLTAGDLAKLPRRSVQAKDHDGKDTAFEGIEIAEVLKLAGVKSGEQLRG